MTSGKIELGADELNAVALRTVHFVRQQLPAWRDDPNRPDEKSENRLNLQLCKFLDSRARNDFPMVRFDHEEYQGGGRAVDLSISPSESKGIGALPHTLYDPILVLECKRLPAPPPIDRKKEYVTGGKDSKSGGIQRFKLGLHGAGLNLVGMIGYVQERSPREWHREINKWILELAGDPNADACVWCKTEILGSLDDCVSEGLASCQSIHGRTDSRSNKEVEIHHLWVVMNTGKRK